jgi:hypothetical protein
MREVMRQIVLMIFAVIGMCMPMIGCLIGLRRYRKYGRQTMDDLERRRKEEWAKGNTLFYKRNYRTVFSRTIGLPMVIGLLVGLVILCIVFKLA